jgi:hypothetical protein
MSTPRKQPALLSNRRPIVSKKRHRVTWITDIHRNSFGTENCEGVDYQKAVENIRRTRPKSVLLNTDFAEASELIQFLKQLQYDVNGCPLYFTVGNHTHRNSIQQIRRELKEYLRDTPTITHVGACDQPIALTESVALVGYDGWSEASFERWAPELENLKQDARHQGRHAEWQRPSQRLESAAAKASVELIYLLAQAARQFPIVVLLTQLPLWPALSDIDDVCSNYPNVPLLVSPLAGELVEAEMQEKPWCRLIVLCGHVQRTACHAPLPNVEALTGQAQTMPPGVRIVLGLPD